MKYFFSMRPCRTTRPQREKMIYTGGRVENSNARKYYNHPNSIKGYQINPLGSRQSFFAFLRRLVHIDI